jgi:hypothetical protein
MIKTEGNKRSRNIPAQMFKGSYSWIHHFTCRCSLSIRKRTTIFQQLLEEYENKIVVSYTC